MRYGLYGDEPDDDSDVWDFGFDGVIATISTAKDRYTKRIDVPQEELERFVNEGRSQQEIASYYNCSVDTIQRRMKQYGITRRKAAEITAKPQEPHRAAEIPQKDRKQFNENDNENEEEKEDGKANNRRVSF
jgi:transposase